MKFETDLCKIAYKYGTDKCPEIRHPYTPVYYKLLNDKRESIKKVIEVGIGYYKTIKNELIVHDRGLNRNYHRGASLLMWRDFFPNAQIYGVDKQPDTMFKDKRIKTFVYDERREEDLKNLIKKTGSDIDLFIDDGSHRKNDQIFMCKTIMPLLKKDVIYIIEDAQDIDSIIYQLGKKYHYEVPKLYKNKWLDKLIIIKHKNV